MDSHPIDLADDPESAEIQQVSEEKGDDVSELSKAKFVASAGSEELQEIIKQKSKTISQAVAMSEEKQRNIIIFDAETLSKEKSAKPQTSANSRTKDIPPSQGLATLRVESA